jgi:hypothetical protein
MKSKNKKENHKNYQNQGPGIRFWKSKYSTVRVAIPTIKLKVMVLLSRYSSLAWPNLLLNLVPLVHKYLY